MPIISAQPPSTLRQAGCRAVTLPFELQPLHNPEVTGANHICDELNRSVLLVQVLSTSKIRTSRTVQYVVLTMGTRNVIV
jgi:hypothetical protein